MKYVITGCLLFICCVSFADNNAKKLQSIHTEIKQVQKKLTLSKKQQQQLQQSLKQSEIAIGKLSINLANSNNELSNIRKELQSLTEKKSQQELQLQTNENQLNEQLQAAYSLGKQHMLKLYLSQQDPTKLSRQHTYYQYLMKDRLAIIDAISEQLSELAQTQQAIQEKEQQAQKVNLTLQEEQHELAKKQQERQTALSTLNSQIVSQTSKLQQLDRDKQAVEALIAKLQSKDFAVANSKTFSKLRGKLPWPVKGQVTNNFGASIDQSQIKWSGVLLKAPLDEPIRAIAPGKVIFSNWMQGFGLLLILDHGNGYMTIYGRNNSLYKNQGDSVAAGELIATVGHSGGYQENALYFDIRHEGKPLNPKRWCAA